jgi:anti-sigma regulatory factor (Ser/Thr protein kinase)
MHNHGFTGTFSLQDRRSAGGPAQARRIIAEELSALLSPRELDDVKLMVSELVTNGIVHGGHERDAR